VAPQARRGHVDGRIIAKVCNWLQAEYVSVPVPTLFNGLTTPCACIRYEKLKDYLLNIDAPVVPTLDECVRRGWIVDLRIDVLSVVVVESTPNQAMVQDVIQQLQLPIGKNRIVGIYMTVFDSLSKSPTEPQPKGLNPCEKYIIRKLRMNSPMDQRALANASKGNYSKNYIAKFTKGLQEKGLIEKVGRSDYHITPAGKSIEL
jgi:hypothetical protein